MDIVEEMRGFEVDHEPDGWPAVKMKQVSALCDEIDALRAELLRITTPKDDEFDVYETFYIDAREWLRPHIESGKLPKSVIESIQHVIEFWAASQKAAPVPAMPMPKQDPSVADVVEAVAEFVEAQQGGPFDSSVMACAIRGQLKYGELFKNITPSPRITEQDAREIPEDDLWALLDAIEKALFRKAAPHAWEAIVTRAGHDFITNRRALLNKLNKKGGD